MYQGLDYQRIEGELFELRETGYPKGQYPGFDSLYEITSYKKGYPVYIAGAPHAGKTQFLIETLVTKSELYGEKHILYLGESGSLAEQYGEIIHTYAKKPFMKHKSKGVKNEYAMTDQEYYDSLEWVKKHFYLIEDFDPFDLWGFYAQVEKIERNEKVIFETTSIDPFMHLEIPEKFNNRDDKHLKDALKHCNDNSKKNNRVNFLVNHIADLPYMTDKDTGRRYYPMAMPNEWAGGRMWHRFAYTMLLVYRCPEGITDHNGEPYPANQTIVQNQKAKPKGTGKLGDAKIFWDWKRNRYYEEDRIGTKIYSHSKRDSPINYEATDEEVPF